MRSFFFFFLSSSWSVIVCNLKNIGAPRTHYVAVRGLDLSFHELEISIRSAAIAVAISGLYACGIVYLRLFPLTECKKCNRHLPLVREEVSRRHAREAQDHSGNPYRY